MFDSFVNKTSKLNWLIVTLINHNVVELILENTKENQQQVYFGDVYPPPPTPWEKVHKDSMVINMMD